MNKLQKLHNEALAQNIIKCCTLSATSTEEPYFLNNLFGPTRGTQSAKNYWASVAGIFPAQISIQLDRALKVSVLYIMAMQPNDGFTYEISGINIYCFLGGIRDVVARDLTIVSAKVCRDVSIRIDREVDEIMIEFTRGVENHVFVGGLQLMTGVPSTLPEAYDWLAEKSREMIHASKKIMTTNGSITFPPQVESGYKAFWLRDYAYIIETCAQMISRNDLIGALNIFAGAKSSKDEMVDCVAFDGKPHYKPGYGEMGDNMVADAPQFFAKVLYHTWKAVGDSVLDRVDIASACLRALPMQGDCVFIDPAKDWDRCPYGFTDTVRKRGKCFFETLLYIEAVGYMAEMYRKLGRTSDVIAWEERRQASIRALEQFWSPSAQLYNACTVSNVQPDIWGSAYAVYLGITGHYNEIIDELVSKYDVIVRYGHVRHTYGAWQTCPTGYGQYQNGGYWPTATGWVAYCISRRAPDLAKKMILDMVELFIRVDITEWISEDGTSGGVGQYISSATLPLGAIQRIVPQRELRDDIIGIVVLRW